MARSIFVSLLLFVALLVGLSSANAQGTEIEVSLNGSAIAQLDVTGFLVCSYFGESIPLILMSPPLEGVSVTLYCNQSTVAQAVTNYRGLFQLTLTAPNYDTSQLLECRVVIPLPVTATCALIPSEGSLVSPILITSLNQTSEGVIVTAMAPAYVHVLES